MTMLMKNSEWYEFINRIMHEAREMEKRGWARNDLERCALSDIITGAVDMQVYTYLDHWGEMGNLIRRAMECWDGSIIYCRWKDGNLRKTLNELATAAGIDDEYEDIL